MPSITTLCLLLWEALLESPTASQAYGLTPSFFLQVPASHTDICHSTFLLSFLTTTLSLHLNGHLFLSVQHDTWRHRFANEPGEDCQMDAQRLAEVTQRGTHRQVSGRKPGRTFSS